MASEGSLGGGWVEEAWSDSPRGGGGSATAAASRGAPSGGGRSAWPRGSSGLASQGLGGDDDEDSELDPWGEFLTLQPSGAGAARDFARRPASGLGPAGASSPPSERESGLRSGLSSLVQMGQQLVRQHEEQGRGVVRSLWKSLDSLQHLQPGPAGATPRLAGPGGSSSASGPLARPLLAVQAEEGDLSADAHGSAPSSAAPSPVLRGSHRRSSGAAATPSTSSRETPAAQGCPFFWGLWHSAPVPASQEQSAVHSLGGRRSGGDGAPASAGSPSSLVVPLRASLPRGAQASAPASSRPSREQHGSALGGPKEEEEEEDAEAALMKEEMLRIGRPRRAHWRWGEGGGGRHDRHTCLHKSLEVLPVLAVVALLVLGTVAYFTIVDRVLAQFRAPFSISCNVEPGSWVQRPATPASSPPSLAFAVYNPEPGPAPGALAPPSWASATPASAPAEASGLYAPSCPFIRDEFNCAKYGLPAGRAPRGLAWQPQSCQLVPVKPLALLRLLRNRGVAFVGDMTVANQFDSFICQLAQQEHPIPIRAPWVSGQSTDQRARGLQEAPDRHAPPGGWAGRGASGGLNAVPGEKWVVSRGEHSGKEPDSRLWGFWPFASSRTGGSSTAAPSSAGGGSGRSSPSGAEVSDASVGEEAAWEVGRAPPAPGAAGGKGPTPTREEARKTLFLFPAHNVTVAFYHSPFLVRADVHARVNATACLQSKVLAVQAGGRAKETESASEVRGGPAKASGQDATSPNGTATASSPSAAPSDQPATGAGAVEAHCYPNTLELAAPDALWASEARQYDVLLLSSGRAWTEEAVERLGLGLRDGGRRAGGLSLEGLQGQWAFPRAMAAVARWLDNSSNFAGTAVFRSFSPHHDRRDCQKRDLLSSSSEAFAEENGNSFKRYNDAFGAALENTRHLFLNVTALSWERADGHPWMSSPARPRVDCGNWCLPGVPDTWNQILGNMIVQLLRTRDD